MAGKRKTRSASKASRSLDSCHETPLGQKERKAGRKAKDEKIGTVLYALPNLVRGTLRKRPSAHIKSPYVADVDIHTQSGDVEVLAHCPCLDVRKFPTYFGCDRYLITLPSGRCLSILFSSIMMTAIVIFVILHD